MRLLDDSPRTRLRYADLLSHSAHASVYQTGAWLDVWQRLGATVMFVEVDHEALIPFVVKGRGLWRRAYSLPFDTYGGIVTPNGNAPVGFEGAVAPLGRSSVRIADFSAGMTSANGAARPTRTYLVDLTDGYAAAAARYTDANRRLLRQAFERGVRVDEVAASTAVGVFHHLHRRTLARYGARPLARRFFEVLFASLAATRSGTFYVARAAGAVVGANLVLRHRDHAYDWMWVYDERFLHLRTTNLLLDRAIHDEAMRGARELNLGQSPGDRSGSVRFKQSFGATPFEYAVYSHTQPWVTAAREARARWERFGARMRFLETSSVATRTASEQGEGVPGVVVLKDREHQEHVHDQVNDQHP